ncbi:hypothetical protein HanPI659440_Chr16g0621861 [Helianthus annuus]|nr:hypothetical protein HanPI659440_Chr16g0621861 [Helianthus annuus]
MLVWKIVFFRSHVIFVLIGVILLFLFVFSLYYILVAFRKLSKTCWFFMI